jgi:hypothetical protein
VVAGGADSVWFRFKQSCSKAVLLAEVVSHFPGQGPEALLEVASVLTGKDREQLRRAGGLLFIDPTTEAEVFRWPAT